MTDRTHVWRIDGIDEGVARVEEDGDRMITVPIYLLPAGASEGQRLQVARTTAKGSVTLTISIDEAGTAADLAASRAQTAAIAAQSRKRDPGGDVAL
jgi:Protein of unknown function (DUF3006).